MKRLQQLDLLKFIAAAFLILFHFQRFIPYDNKAITFYGGTIYLGYFVELFFMLSGLFCGLQLYNHKYPNSSFIKYILSKLYRLYPTTFISITILTLLIFLEYNLTNQPTSQLNALSILSTYLLLNNVSFGLFTNTFCYDEVLWFIPAILLCYILYYIAIYIFKKTSIKPYIFFITYIILGLIIQFFKINFFVFNAYTSRGFITFFLGVLLFFFYKSILNIISNNTITIASIVIISISILLLFISRTIFSKMQLILQLILFPSIIILFLSSKQINKLFNNKICGFLGKISFQMYIWQIPAFYVIMILRDTGIIMNINDFTMTLTLLGIIIFSMIIYLAIELPLNKLFKKF